jgi:hypothetical protein
MKSSIYLSFNNYFCISEEIKVDEFWSNNFCLVMNHPHALLFSFVKQITHVMLDLFPLLSCDVVSL